MLPSLITVVIPCFNASRTLEAAVESVLAQGDIGVDIILVDDCSTDETTGLARALVARYSNITFLTQPANSGPGPTRNTGVRHARTEFVCCLDADDTYVPGFFTAALRHFRQHSMASGVFTGIELIDCPHPAHGLHIAGAINFMASNKMLRRTTFELIGGFPEDPVFRTGMGGEDGAFFQVWMKYFLSVFEPTKYCRHYVGPNSHFSRFVRRTRAENGKLVFVELEPIESSGALTATILEFEKRFLDRCRMLRNSAVFPEFAASGFQPGLIGPAQR